MGFRGRGSPGWVDRVRPLVRGWPAVCWGWWSEEGVHAQAGGHGLVPA